MVDQKLKELNIELDQKLKEKTKELKESKEKLRLFMESSIDGFVLFDSELNYIDVNNISSKILGINKEDLIGKNILDIAPGLKKTGRYDKYLDVLKTGKPFSTEDVIFNRLDGSMSVFLSVRAFKGGENLGVIFTDITERKKAEEKLITSEFNLRERVKELSCLYGLSQLVDNPDLSLEEIIRGTLNLIINAWQFPEITCAAIKYDNKIFQTDNFIETNWKLTTYLRINEKLLVIEVYYLEDKPFLEEEELLINDIGNRLKVIIEQKEAKQKLKESEEKYRHLFDIAPISVMLFNFKGTIVDCNTSTENLFGDKKDDLIGKKFIDLSLKSSEFKSILNDKKENLLKKKIKKPFEVKFYREDDTFIWVNLHYSLISIDNEAFILIIIQDITERKRGEEIIKDEIEKLKKLDKTKSNFIIRVSHELKTPLNHSFSTSNLLLKEYKDQMNDNVKELVEIMNKGGLRMKKLIENMLDASKIEANMLELKYSEENLTEIINECVNEISYFLKKRHLILDIDLPVNLPFEVDRVRIKQVFTNILTNAIKNTPPKGKIFIYLKQENNYFDINIRDTGIGLTEEEKLQIFKKFGKIERYGKRMDVDIEGSGLGLYISKEIVQLHGGHIFVISEGRNKGATFIVRLLNKKPDE